MLTAERLREVLRYDPDTGVFTWITRKASTARPGDVTGYVGKLGYAQIRIDGVLHYAHRLAWLYMTGEPPTLDMDHINGDRADNRFSNLRHCTRAQNLRNGKLKPSNKSGFKGVSQHSQTGKWIASIKFNYKAIYLGSFDTPEQAAKAYQAAASRLHGEFAKFP